MSTFPCYLSNFEPSPYIPVKSLFRFSSLAPTACAVISGSEEVPGESRKLLMLLSIFKYLWKGSDNVTRLSTINEYVDGGIKMIDQESMIKSLRLALLKRVFGA